MKGELDGLIAISREYGSDPRWVVAGGGNTSLKSGDILFIKASGFPLATIGEEGFARMDRQKLDAIWSKSYPDDGDKASVARREQLVLDDMMASRMPGEEKRPSVEAQLHDLLPWPLVVHLHPTLVNGLTCAKNGETTALDVFGDDQLWIEMTDPGYILAKKIRDRLIDRTSRGLGDPEYIFLANHGVFVGGQNSSEVQKKYERLEKELRRLVKRNPNNSPEKTSLPVESESLKKAAVEFFGDSAEMTFVKGGEMDRYLDTAAEAKSLTGCLTPDHIVYAGPGALYLDADGADVGEAWIRNGNAYLDHWGKPANIVLMPEFGGALVAAAGSKALANAKLLLENALDVAAYTESFGGPELMEEPFIRFIVEWEVENYRSKQATSG